MIKLIYNDYYHYDKETVTLLLQSSKPTDVIDGLLYTILGQDDYNLSLQLVKRLIKSPDQQIRACAFRCIGDLTRIHGRLDFDSFVSILDHTINSESKAVQEDARDVLETIYIYFQPQYLSPTYSSELHRQLSIVLPFREHQRTSKLKDLYNTDFMMIEYLLAVAIGRSENYEALREFRDAPNRKKSNPIIEDQIDIFLQLE